jgi:hypothetical protein
MIARLREVESGRSTGQKTLCNVDELFRTLPTPHSLSCAWTIYYDANRDDGVTFHNVKHSCSLATTFRSLPSPRRTNDTLSRVMNLELEASCTSDASSASSRVYMIDAMPSNPRPSAPPDAGRTPVPQRIQACLQLLLLRSMQHLQARRQLSKFRHYHAVLQDSGLPPLLTEGRRVYFDILEMSGLVMALFLGSLGTGIVLWHRGFGTTRWTGCSRYRVGVAGAFVLTHVTAYYFLGCQMLHSSRAAVLLSCFGLRNMLVPGPLGHSDGRPGKIVDR